MKDTLRSSITEYQGLALHHSEKTKNLQCDGMRCFEVHIRKHKRGDEIKYWCCPKRGYFDPFTLKQCEKWRDK